MPRIHCRGTSRYTRARGRCYSKRCRRQRSVDRCPWLVSFKTIVGKFPVRAQVIIETSIRNWRLAVVLLFFSCHVDFKRRRSTYQWKANLKGGKDGKNHIAFMV